MSGLIDVILPVFLVIGFGYVVAWRGLFSDAAVDGLMRFAQNFAVPVLLARSIAKLDLGASYDAGLMISFYAGALISFAIGITAARFVLGRTGPEAVAIGFCCLFSNSLLLGVPITERAYGHDALAGNFAIISILVIGILCGFAIQALRAVTGHDLPEPVWAAMNMMAGAALPAALFGLGGVLFRYRPEGDSRAIAMVTTLSLIVHPGVAWFLGHWVFDLSTPALRSAVMTASMAPGVNAYLFANMYGAGRRVAASSVLIATAGSILTIWMWLAILP
jgi:predicted permease